MSSVLAFRPGRRNSAFPLPAASTIDAGACEPIRHALRVLPACPRCDGFPYEQGEPSLCESCTSQLEAIDREDAAEDRARELAEDREYWGTR